MAITDTLGDIWHGIEDKAWSLSDFLEDKGIPISSFCESKGISPVFVFLGIIIAILLILALVSGGGGGGGGAVLTVHVTDESGNPVQTNLKVTYGTTTDSGSSDINGKAILNVPFTSVTVTIVDSKYSGQSTITVAKALETMDLSATTIKGTLRVVVNDKAGGFIQVGAIDIKTVPGGTIVGSTTIDGSSKYDFTLPVGIYSATVKSVSGGQLGTPLTKEITSDSVFELDFSIDANAANSASVSVTVKDETGTVVPNAYVILKNGRDDAAIGTQQVTDSAGQAVFSNIAIGTSVYPIVFVPNDKRYGTLSEYDSKTNYKKTVMQTQESIDVTLPLNGRVDVVVWDKESMAYISGASVTIKSKAGDVVSTTKQTDSQGKVAFSGFEENLEVYPVVKATGFKDYENSQDARPISYTAGATTAFTVSMERDGSFIGSMISVNATDTYGDPVTGLNAILSDTGGGFIKGLNNSNNVSFEIDATKLYNLALYKSGYLRKVLEGIGPGTQSVEMDASNTVNAGDVRVCTYVMINGKPSEATSKVDLYLSTGSLIDSGKTVGGGDGDNCITFPDIPVEWMVYASATNDGYSPVETTSQQVIKREDGFTLINATFNQITPNAAAVGGIKVCVTNANNKAVTGAEVLLYDIDLDGPSWTGDYQKSTTADGCIIFSSIPIEKTDYQGLLSPVKVYAIVSASGYSTYNGKTAGNTVQVQANRTTPLNVQLGIGQAICVTVKNNGNAVSGADVSLCANALCSQVMDTQKTESDGHAIFSSDVTSVTVKAVANVDSLVKEQIESFALSQVTQGQCGTIDLVSVSAYTSVTLDGINGSYMEVNPGQNAEVQFLVRVGSSLATGGAMPTGGQNYVLAGNNTRVLIGFSGSSISPGIIHTVDAANGEYALPITAPSSSGTYTATLSASIDGCSTCQGGQLYMTVKVKSPDSDGDGVPDDLDKCPNTARNITVDSTGCPVASLTDSDGDGVVDSIDKCPNTMHGLTVDSTGCPVVSPIAAAAAAAATTTTTTTTTNTTSGIPNQWDNPQSYQASVRVCVVDEVGSPVYDSSILLYGTTPSATGAGGYGYGTPYAGYGTGYGGTTAGGTAGYTACASGYYNYGNGCVPVNTGTGACASGYYNYGNGCVPVNSGGYGAAYGSGPYGTYGSAYGNTGGGTFSASYYSQPWQATYSQDNCRTFVGYTAMQGMDQNMFFSNFFLNINAKGYEPYNSTSSNSRNSISLTLGGGNTMFTVQVKLKRGKNAQIGQGSITDPTKEVDLQSASWKPEDQDKKTTAGIYPLVTMTDRNMNLIIKYSIGSGAPDSLDYAVKYSISGSACYYIEDSTGSAIPNGLATGTTVLNPGGKTMNFRKGQGQVQDEITIYSKDSCWENNDPALESEFTLTMSGQLIQIGDKEATSKTTFTPARVNVKPLIGATKELKSTSDLQRLSGIMTLSDGVVTIGALPYCVDPKGNTDKSRTVSTRGLADRTAADHKIVLEFEGTNAPMTTMNDIVSKITEYIRGRIRKTPADCKTYITVYDKYKGYVQVGQKGFACHDASAQVEGTAKQAEPWQKLFCDTIANGVQGQIQLGGSYSMRVDSK